MTLPQQFQNDSIRTKVDQEDVFVFIISVILINHYVTALISINYTLSKI